jgi:large subunit ribosomal protein L13
MKTTFFAKNTDVVKKWVVIDATDKPLGRVASTAASIIRGKTKPIYTPHVDTGDNVIIINAAKVKLTGKKWDDKIYYHHTGWPGGIKSVTAKQVLEKQPSDLRKKAIQGMLPKTRLGRTLHNNFRIYNNDQHPHTSQNPEVVVGI